MIEKLETILWDVDGTLLDFEAAEDLSIVSCLKKYGYDITQQQLDLYKVINKGYWEAFERKEVTREYLYPHRFLDWFEKIGVEGVDPNVLNDEYQIALGETPVLREDTLAVLQHFKGKVKQYVVSNGSTVAQKIKLKKSGIIDYMDGVFISEEMGVSKPDIAFFDEVKKWVKYETKTTIIVGDSLTSDIKGGNNAGIYTVWFNEKEMVNNTEIRVDETIKSLSELVK